MEREPIPVITAQVSVIALIYLGYLWCIDKIPSLSTDKYYLALGAVIIIIGPVISQVIFGFWKKYWGFRSYDVTKYLCNGLPSDKAHKVQIIFDNFWHNSSNVNEKIIEYSRRRSVVCQMNLFVSKLLAIGSFLFLIITFINAIDSHGFIVWRGMLMFFSSGVLAILFCENFKINGKELRGIESRNIKKIINENNDFDNFKEEYKKLTKQNLEEVLKEFNEK